MNDIDIDNNIMNIGGPAKKSNSTPTKKASGGGILGGLGPLGQKASAQPNTTQSVPPTPPPTPTSVYTGPVVAATKKADDATSDDGNKLNLLKLMHAALDSCADGESLVVTKFKDDKTIKLRFGYNVGTQVARKTIKAATLKEALVNLLEEILEEKMDTKKVRRPIP